MNKKYFDLLKR